MKTRLKNLKIMIKQQTKATKNDMVSKFSYWVFCFVLVVLGFEFMALSLLSRFSTI
jgi:hypothetical protein